MPPSKLIVTNICFPQVFFLVGGFIMGGRSNPKSFCLLFYEGVIVPQSKLIVTNVVPPKGFCCY